MLLSEYLQRYVNMNLNVNKLVTDHILENVYDNSKNVSNNSVFVAINGYSKSGLVFINEAIKNGALTIIYDDENYRYNKDKYPKINFIYVSSSKVELARLLKIINKDKKMPNLIGITGTNGKTTVTNIVYECLKNSNINTLLIGTEGIKSYYDGKEEYFNSVNTTPSISELYKYIYLHNYVFVVMEVSSQGIIEGRVLGLKFKLICLTNITQDHLDYHKTIDNYANAKARLAINLDVSDYLVINNNSDYANLFINSTIAKLITYNDGYNKRYSNYTGRIINRYYNKMDIVIWDNKNCYEITTNLCGDFNVQNILASYSILKTLKIDKEVILNTLKTFKPVIGRMNYYLLNKDRINKHIIIDYAHTPDGIQQVLNYYNNVKHKKIKVVIGCGGNRDKSKRALIGNIVSKNADFVYLTEDNSRNEKTIDIIEDIKKGLNDNNYQVILSRKQAIESAINESNDGDIILILGKGAEQFIISDKKNPFSDIIFVESLLYE